MKKIYTVFAFSLLLLSAQSKTYTINSGKWSDVALWNGQYIGSVVKSEDVVIITGQITMNTSIVVEGTLQVEKGAGMVGMKDLVIAKGGKFVNNGNTVMKTIINEGNISNNMIMEAINNIENKSVIENNNNMVAGNNMENFGGNATGNGGAYYINNTVSVSPSAKFGSEVNVFYGNLLNNQTVSTPSANVTTTIGTAGILLTIINPVCEGVSFYAIEKSTDGKNYTLIEMLSSIKSEMTYTDTETKDILTHYRVKAISGDGVETILPIATVKIPTMNGYALAR